MPPELPTGQYYRIETIAKLVGRTERRIYQLTESGVLRTVETEEGTRYDLFPTIYEYIQYIGGKGKNEAESALRQKKITAEIALKESQGELHRLRTEIAAGKYISKEEVTLDYRKFFATFKKFALGIPARVADMISDVAEPLEVRRVEKAINGEIRQLLTSFVVAGVTELPQKRKRKNDQ